MYRSDHPSLTHFRMSQQVSQAMGAVFHTSLDATLVDPDWIAFPHVAPVLGESAYVTETVGTPTRPVLRGISQAITAADQHQQRRLLEGGKIGINHLGLVLDGRQFVLATARSSTRTPPPRPCLATRGASSRASR